MKKKRFGSFGKRGEESSPIGNVVNILIILLVLAIVIIGMTFFYKNGFLSWAGSLPDFIRTTPDLKRVECPAGSQEVGYVDKGYVMMDKRTGLYLKGQNIKISINGIDKDFAEIKRINSKDVIVLGGEALRYLEDVGTYRLEVYLKDMPSKENVRLLNNAFLEQGSICSENKIVEPLVKAKDCILTCSLIEGVCSKTSVNGKISNLRMDCKEGELCYVDASFSKIESDKFKFEKSSYLNNYYGLVKSSTLADILDFNTFIISIGAPTKLVMNVNSLVSFCYAFDTDKTYMNKGYVVAEGLDRGKIYNIASNTWTQAMHNFIQIVVWNPNTNEKIIRRWKIEARSIKDSGFDEDGKLIDDKNFLSEMVKAPALKKGKEKDSTFYVILSTPKTFMIPYKGLTKSAQTFQIIKESDSRAQVWAYSEEEKTFVQLKCGNAFYYTLPLSSAKQSLFETLSNCNWDFWEG